MGTNAFNQVNQKLAFCLQAQRQAQLHIVAMTANVMPGNRPMCLAAGMDDYVTKPIRVDALIDALSNTLARRAIPTMDPG